MMQTNDDHTSALLLRATGGSSGATQELMQMYRDRLRRMVSSRLDARLTGRLDASDVVQDVMMSAASHLNGYAESPAVPFYVWLRQIALDRLSELYRRHVRVEKRSVNRESVVSLPVSDGSVDLLANSVHSRERSPSEQLRVEDARSRTRDALNSLSLIDRELLLMRYVEQMSLAEIAAQLSLSLSAIKSRHLRALDKMAGLLRDEEASS